MEQLVTYVRQRFEALADPTKAGPMAAYMKTQMPFYGIQKPERMSVYRDLKHEFPITSASEYKQAVLALWSQPHREEKYAAIYLAGAHERFVKVGSMPLYRRLIVEGAWWDFVDEISIQIVGRVMLNQRSAAKPITTKWVSSDNFWLRRAAIICQIKHKHETDERMLFDFCLRCAHEREFFVRKAIGWALREYAKTSPRQVAAFLRTHRSTWSSLTYREASKHLR